MTPRALSVAEVHASVQAFLGRRFRGLAIVGVAVALLALLVVAWVVVPSSAGERPTVVPLVLDSLLVVALLAGGVRWWRFRARHLASDRVAATMEEAGGVAEGLVRGSLEFAARAPEGVSRALVDRGQNRLAQRLSQPIPELAGDVGSWLQVQTRRGMTAAAVLAPLVVLLAVVSPQRAGSGWGGLLRPVRALLGPALPPLLVEPGDAEVVRGASLDVRIEAVGREGVTLWWQAAGDVARTRELRVVAGRAEHTFEELTAGVVYRVDAADGASSGEFVITPRDPLFVTDVQVALEFPPYTGRLPEEYRGDVPPLQVPVGTRVVVDGQGSRPLATAALVPVRRDSLGSWVSSDGPSIDLTIDASSFSTQWRPTRGGAWEWRFEDTQGGQAELHPPPLELALLPDAPPDVAITMPGPDTLLPLNLKQPLVLQAADDYGVAWLELVAWRVTALGEAREPVTQRMSMGGNRVVLARPLMDVSTWGLVPGDQVRYYARVVDNGPGAQEARTPEFVLRMPAASELRREAQEQMEDAAAELEALAEQARRAAEDTRALERQARAPSRAEEGQPFREEGQAGVDFEEREGLQAALEEQQAMAAQVDSLRQELGAMSETLSEAGAQDAGLRSDLADLQELLEEIGGAEMQERLSELAQQMSDMDRRDAREALEELAREEDEFREKLEEALDRMKRAAAQQDFRATGREAEELADRQEALAEAMAEEATEDRAAQQELLRQEALEMDQKMEQLADRLRELGEEQAAEGVDQARAEAQESSASMQEAAQQARAGESQQAGQQGQQAAQEMDEAAKALQAAQQKMMQERAEAFQRALEQTSQDAQSLARRQAEIREAMQGASPETMAALRGQVAGLEAGLRNMAENLAIAAQTSQAGGGERPVSEAMGTAMGALERVVQSLDSPSGRQLSPQAAAEQAIDALNQTAMQSLAAAQQLSEGGSSAASAEEVQEQLEQLAQEQADVNNQASQMMPMQLTPQAQQQQMEQLAQQQQEVASNVGQMANQEGENGPLGDLEALAQEAEAIARELAQGRLEPETRERQERLFHRLLDAGRSLEKDEMSDERESEAASLVERGEVAPLGPDALGLLRYEPDAAALRRLPPAARALVVRYFQRLNGDPGAAPAGAAPAAAGGGDGGGR